MQNAAIDVDNNDSVTSDLADSSVKSNPQNGAEAVATRIHPIIEHDDKDVEYSNDNNSIERNDVELGTENKEKEAPSSFKCAASVARSQTYIMPTPQRQ
jgi:hypothetical protein